jgi:hypothetical protein
MIAGLNSGGRMIPALVVALSLVSSQSSKPAPDACAVLDPASIKQAIGADAQPGKAGTSYFAGNTNCDFKLAGNAVLQVIVTTGANQPNYFKPRNAQDQRFLESSPLEGVGDRAYIWPATANNGSVAFLKGTSEVDLRVSGLGKVLTPAQLTALAKAALAKF